VVFHLATTTASPSSPHSTIRNEMRLPSAMPVAFGLLGIAFVLLAAQSHISTLTLLKVNPSPSSSRARRDASGGRPYATTTDASGSRTGYSSSAISTAKQLSDLARYHTTILGPPSPSSNIIGAGPDLAAAAAGDGLSAADRTPQSGDLVIGVLTDPDSLRGLPLAAYNTWVQDIAPYAKVQNLLRLMVDFVFCLPPPPYLFQCN